MIILASQSPRRALLLRKLGLKFKVIPSRVREHIPKNIPPKKFAADMAFRKAASVAKRVKKGLVIGADTIVVCKGEIIGKPKNIKDAKRILKKLSNTKQKVLTAVCVYDAKTKRKKCAIQTSAVFTKRMTDKQIEAFAKRHLDKAGAYAVQQKNDKFIEKIEGDYYNVVGLPVKLVKRLLGGFGVVCRPN